MALNKASLASSLLGLGPGGGGLQKLTITHDGTHPDISGPIQALFNPGELTRSRRVTWEPLEPVNEGGGWTAAPVPLRFGGTDPQTFEVDLFFDTYEARTPASGWQRSASFVLPAVPGLPGQASEATDVTVLTRRVTRLAEVDQKRHRTPICELSWGTFEKIFTGVLTGLTERITLFLADGTPVRSTLSCSFLEADWNNDALALELESSDVVKTWVVRRHDTLQGIAAAEYGDPRQWRRIATANGVVRPRDVRPGMVLTIPKLTR